MPADPLYMPKRLVQVKVLGSNKIQITDGKHKIHPTQAELPALIELLKNALLEVNGEKPRRVTWSGLLR